jgi:hypothetical protein
MSRLGRGCGRGRLLNDSRAGQKEDCEYKEGARRGVSRASFPPSAFTRGSERASGACCPTLAGFYKPYCSFRGSGINLRRFCLPWALHFDLKLRL